MFTNLLVKNVFFNKNIRRLIPNRTLFQSMIRNYCNIFNTIDRTLLNNYVDKIKLEYEQIEKSNNEKRKSELLPVIEILKERNKLQVQLLGIQELSKENDEELKKLAQEECLLYEDKIKNVDKELLESLIPDDEENYCDSILLEVNAGVGGQEAMLFAKEMFDTYCNFAEYKNWDYQFVEYDLTDIGGLRHGSMFVNGPEVYKYFKFEAGVHRVQRIPTTEKSGRVHTSTVSVIALPQPKEIDIVIHDKDLRIETKRSSGAGGQHVNTTDSAVRIVHLPTNTAVECQVDRSQIKNRQIAMQKLRALLYEKQLNEQKADTEATRKAQVRSNFRNEKIRTYNFNQDRITDHRLQGNNFHNLKVFFEGREPLEQLIQKLNETSRYKHLLEILSSVK